MALHPDSHDVHDAAYVQASDPGTIGAGRLWLDTSGGTGTWTIKSRNAADTGWETVNAGSVSAGTITAALLLQGVIDSASLGATQNNYAPTGIATASWIRLTSSVDVDITGLTTGASGRTIALVNIGSFNITLKDESGSSTATNRFALNGDIVLSPDTGVIIIYDNTTQRWRALMLPATAPISAQYVTLAANSTLTAEAVLGSAVIMSGVFASRPASATAGLLYYSTDTDTLYRDNGVSWDAWTLDWGQVTGKPSTFTPASHNHTSTGGDGGVLTDDEHGGFSDYTEIATPTTPSANHNRIFGKDDSGVTKPYSIGEDGITRPLASIHTTINVMLSGGGFVISTGVQLDLEIDFNCVIEQVTLLADQTGSIVVDLWKDVYASYPPNVGDTITSAAKPTISSATKSQDSILTGWTTTVSAGDIIRVNVDSVTSITRCTIALKVRRT